MFWYRGTRDDVYYRLRGVYLFAIAMSVKQSVTDLPNTWGGSCVPLVASDQRSSAFLFDGCPVSVRFSK